jgi:hypothetical protein
VPPINPSNFIRYPLSRFHHTHAFGDNSTREAAFLLLRELVRGPNSRDPWRLLVERLTKNWSVGLVSLFSASVVATVPFDGALTPINWRPWFGFRTHFLQLQSSRGQAGIACFPFEAASSTVRTPVFRLRESCISPLKFLTRAL